MLPLIFLTTAAAETPQQINQWIRARSDDGQTDQIQQFGDLPEGYPARLTRWVRSQLARSASLALSRFQEGRCEESSRLRVLSPGLTGVSEGDLADGEVGARQPALLQQVDLRLQEGGDGHPRRVRREAGGDGEHEGGDGKHG